MKFLRNKKIILGLVVIIIAVLGFCIAAEITVAEDTPPEDWVEMAKEEAEILPSPEGPKTAQAQAAEVSGLVGFAANIVAGIMTLMAGLLTWAIELGKEVMRLDIVTKGSEVVLDFANLGFVLAIIVIAFATILRFETYAMKQTLWKLIVAALLVNFSLVIAGAFISLSDTVSDVFLQRIKGTEGRNVGSALATLLAPQESLRLASSESEKAGWLAIFSLSFWLKYLASLVFILLFSILIILVFAAIFVMLLIRVIYLAFLLITMPIVWLCWIFPATAGLWREWWDKFLRWTFFAPIMLFFIWLIIETGDKIKEVEATKLVSDSADLGKALEGVTLQEGFFAHSAKLIIIAGLLVGGLIAANRLGITGAKQAMGATQGAGKMFGGYVGRRGTRTAGWLFRPPKTKIDPATGLPYPTTGPRAAIQRRLQNWKTAGGVKGRIAKQAEFLGKAYGKPGEPHKIDKGAIASVWGGMKKGSGLFKKKQKFKVI